MRTDTHISKLQGAAERFAQLQPMHATPSDMPTHPRQYGFEFRWKGIRSLVYYDGQQIRLRDKNGRDTTVYFPELFDLPRVLGRKAVILDGIFVPMRIEDAQGTDMLERRMRVGRPTLALIEQMPVVFIAFDLLFESGKWMLNQSCTRRYSRLQKLGLDSLFWRTNQRSVGKEALIRRNGEANIIAKRLDSIYQPGQRSRDWLEI